LEEELNSIKNQKAKGSGSKNTNNELETLEKELKQL
jgi:hypothetical protein